MFFNDDPDGGLFILIIVALPSPPALPPCIPQLVFTRYNLTNLEEVCSLLGELSLGV